jgi:hypothetical protein
MVTELKEYYFIISGIGLGLFNFRFTSIIKPNKLKPCISPTAPCAPNKNR